MQHQYYVIANLNNPFNDAIMLELLNKGKQIGFTYYGRLINEDYFSKIDPSRVIEIIKTVEYPFIRTKYEDTRFHLYLSKQTNGSISVSFWKEGHSWKKEFPEGIEIVDFDLARYIRLMSKLIKGFEVNKLEAKIEDE